MAAQRHIDKVQAIGPREEEYIERMLSEPWWGTGARPDAAQELAALPLAFDLQEEQGSSDFTATITMEITPAQRRALMLWLTPGMETESGCPDFAYDTHLGEVIRLYLLRQLEVVQQALKAQQPE